MSLLVSAKEPKPGDIIGYARYSDIIAYIDGKPIQTYNIDGHVAIITGDLYYYGFDTNWYSGVRRMTTISRNYWANERPIYYKPEKIPEELVGEIAMPVYYTDIKCYVEWPYREIKSFNVGGKLAIYLKDLAEIYADAYIWNPQERTTRLTLVKYWLTDGGRIGLPKTNDVPAEYENEYSFTFKNQSADDKVNFVLSDWSSDYFVADVYTGFIKMLNPPSVVLAANYLEFSITYEQLYEADMTIKPNLEFFQVINDNVYMWYSGEIYKEDTLENREALAEVLRVFINDEPVSGRLLRSQTKYIENYINYYTFKFDKYYSLEKIDTIRLELGYKDE